MARWALGALVILALGACSPPAAPAPETPLPTPAPKLPRTPGLAAQPAPLAPSTPVRRATPPPVVPEPVATPQELEARYFAQNRTAEDRREIIQTLGEQATPAAGEVLVHIFQREKNQDTRLEALQVACDLPETCRAQQLSILEKAVAPNMARIIRLGALQPLADLEDPHGMAVLQGLRKDPDAAVREVVEDIFKEQ